VKLLRRRSLQIALSAVRQLPRALRPGLLILVLAAAMVGTGTLSAGTPHVVVRAAAVAAYAGSASSRVAMDTDGVHLPAADPIPHAGIAAAGPGARMRLGLGDPRSRRTVEPGVAPGPVMPVSVTIPSRRTVEPSVAPGPVMPVSVTIPSASPVVPGAAAGPVTPPETSATGTFVAPTTPPPERIALFSSNCPGNVTAVQSFCR